MTLEELFRTVADHLLRQGRHSVNADGDCLYRGPKGTRCAVGAVMADAHYRESCEGKDVEDVQVLEILEHSGVPTDDDARALLRDLQSVHDDSSPDAWHRVLDALAEAYGFRWPLEESE